MLQETLPHAFTIDAAKAAFPPSLVHTTPLDLDPHLSEMYDARVYLKREDRQPIRSYKIRGAFHRMAQMHPDERGKGVVCASAGNHAQGVAASAKFFETGSTIFMPRTTPLQKVEATRRAGDSATNIELVGDEFNEAFEASRHFAEAHGREFIHPFDHPDTIAGQGTVAAEIMQQLSMERDTLHAVLFPVGGGGLGSGLATYFRERAPHTQLVGIEPTEAAAMHHSLQAGHPVELKNLSTFVDGAAVRKPGDLTFETFRRLGVDVRTIPENQICVAMHDLYQIQGINVEPAAALSIAGLKVIAEEIRGKTVVCILSGANFDASRWTQVIDRAERFRMRKVQLRVTLPDRAGALDEFLELLGKDINLTSIHYDEEDAGEGMPSTVSLTVRSHHEGRIAQFLKEARAVGYNIELNGKH